jgi:hypothetical protein
MRHTFPHQYECLGSSAGITGGDVGEGVVGESVVGEMEGDTVTGAPLIVGDVVVGTELDGGNDGICVTSIVGLRVISVRAATIVVRTG